MSKLKKFLIDAFEAFFYLFYPKLCLACNNEEPMPKQWYCIHCKIKMPFANHHLEKENEFTRRLWGRVKFESAAAYYLFNKEGRAQKVVHNLKYKGRYQIGIIIGQEFGRDLRTSPIFEDVDLIVPVPLHWKKLRKRGYNQSEVFAQGLSETMEIPYLKDGLKRNENSKSQTKKSKIGRLINVEKVFVVNKEEELKGKHILIVDDVLTSGATLESCANAILELPDTKVSLATIAITQK